jgi:predicted dehydrogenase
MIGAGGWAAGWLTWILPKFADRCEVSALVDIDENALREQGEELGLWPERCFPSMGAAFEAVRTGRVMADCAFVVVPPEHHREAVVSCLALRLDVLCEKPLAASWDDCLAIKDAACENAARLSVVQNYRYTPAMRHARTLIQQRAVGEPYQVFGRFRIDYRKFGSWDGERRHRMPGPVLEDAAIHHLDQVRHLIGADFAEVVCDEWHPAHADGFSGNCCVSLLGRLTNGVRVSYEANVVCAGEQRPWMHEEYRVECADGAVAIRGSQLTVERHENGELSVEHVDPPGDPQRIYHTAVVAEFLDWIDGGPAPETVVDDNLASVAAVIAAARSAERHTWMKVDHVEGRNGQA